MDGPAGDELVGRAALLADVCGWLEQARAGPGRAIVLSGEPGIGKSRLLEAVCSWAAGAGFAVGRGWCSEAGMPAYWPWRRVFAQLAPGLSFGGAAVQPDERPVLLAAVVDALEAAGRERPLLIAIDDVHWADPSSLLLLRTVVDAVPALAAAVVVTVRDDPLLVDAAAREAIAGLPTAVRRLPVPPLEPAAASTLFRRFGGESLPAGTVAGVVGRTGGNPFFITEVARLVAIHGTAAAVVVPPGVREVVQRRIARLPQGCHALLTAAAVATESAPLGPDELDPALLAVVTSTDLPAVLDGLEPAYRGGLLAGDPSGLRFAHALVRETLVEAASLTERGRLHRRVAQALAADDPAAREAVAARAAYHWSRAEGPDAAERAGQWELAAADAAVRTLGFEAAAAHLRKAADSPGVDRVTALLRLGEAQRLSGDLTSAHATFTTAADLAARAGRVADLAAAALGLGGGITGFEVPIADEDQVALLRRAEARLPADDHRMRAAVLARLSVALTGLAGLRERRLLAERAVALADRSGDATVTAASLAALCDASAGPDFVDQRLAAAQRMSALAHDRASTLLARRLALLAHLERGDLAAADAEIAAYHRAAEAAGVALYRWLPEIWRGMRALLRGDLTAAFAHADTAEQIGLRAGSANAALLVFTLRMQAHLTAGSAAEYVEPTREVLAMVQPMGLPLTYLAAPALLLLAAGDRELAQDVLGRYRKTAAEDIERDAEWLEGHWALAELAIRLEDRPAAARLLEVLRPYGKLWAVDGIGGAVFGQIWHQLGALAVQLGRNREAASFLRDAEHGYAEAGAVHLAAQVRELLAGLGSPAPPATPTSTGRIRRDGQFWQFTWREHVSTVPDSKGIRDLAVLLSRPHQPVPAIDLVEAASARSADLGPVLDTRARAAYRARVVELDTEIADAETAADLERAQRLRDERAMLGAELAGAIGLGGRPRTAGDPVDRARKAVTMRLRAALRTVAQADPVLARHLRNAVRTGRTCVYEPDSDVVWRT
ncbi:AAA family ATPase [Actinoplanes sp. KI2]|uniref:ATP-binding protein n=1 Tax=Actinoplanes sp. KI2 TaxID=2983315 RepID=UPI0021D5823B|nr:AAA family ATPase [Actinoplanes sp. KI2]MCU7730038.1 AAA family ATPase [Actinoplanes sp. KI2]